MIREPRPFAGPRHRPPTPAQRDRLPVLAPAFFPTVDEIAEVTEAAWGRGIVRRISTVTSGARSLGDCVAPLDCGSIE